MATMQLTSCGRARLTAKHGPGTRPMCQPIVPVPVVPPPVPVPVPVPVVVVPVPVPAPEPVVTPTVPTTPVPAPVLTVIGGVMNPKVGLAVDTKLLKPVPRLVLSVVGATPKPTDPEPKPFRKPLWNVLPVKLELKTPAAGVDFKVKVGVGNVPTNGLSTPVRFENAVENTEGTAFAKSVLVMGKACNAAKRLVGVVVVVPVVPTVPVVPVAVPVVPVVVLKRAF